MGLELVVEARPEISVEDKKVVKLDFVRYEATKTILLAYPQHKQINAALGIYGEQYKTDMVTFISNIRAQVATYETMITNNELDFEVVFE